MEGYFGVRLSARELGLTVRLGRESGKIHVRLPAAGVFAAYTYRYDPATQTIRLVYNCNCPQMEDIRILCPPSWTRENPSSLKENLSVQTDGRASDFQLISTGHDHYIVLRAGAGSHSILIKYQN